jgi:hypothetical protein
MSKTTILIEGFKGGANSAKAAEAKSVAGFPHEYFKRKAVEMAQRLDRYRQTVEVSSPFNMFRRHARREEPAKRSNPTDVRSLA